MKRISTAIVPLPLIQEEQLSVTGKIMCTKKVNRKVQEEPQAEAAANRRHQEEEKNCHRLMCIANKQMHDTYKDKLPLPQAR